MAISAQRFDFLSRETNVATSDFYKGGSDILNGKVNELKDMTVDMAEFIQNAIQSTQEELTDLRDQAVAEVQAETGIAPESIRDAKKLFGSVRDLAQNAPKQLEKAIGSMLPNNPVVRNMFNQLSNKCRQNAFGRGGLGKPFDASMNCGGKNRKAGGNGCDTGTFSNILNTLTGGAYNSAFNDANGTLAAIMALSMYGYKMNMCGVFGALATSLSSDPTLLSRASGGLLNALSEDGNVLGILDLAGASAGLNGLMENPGGITAALSGFKLPDEVKEFALAGANGLSERFQGAMEIFNSDFGTSLADQVPSIADFGDEYNPDLSALFDADSQSRGFSVDDLGTAPDFKYSDYAAISYGAYHDGITF